MSSGRRAARVRPGRSAAWVGHPVTLVAGAVLVVNDHVLKAALPGLLTGKLSDVAGLLVAPPLLALLFGTVGRRSGDRVAVAALCVTGAGFASVKASSAAAAVASSLWSWALPSRVAADPWDLLALPALVVAWRVWTRVRPSSERPEGRVGRVARARVLVAVPLLVGATVASASPWRPFSDAAVGTRDGAAVVVEFGGAGTAPLGTVLSSPDAGATWQAGPGGFESVSAVPGLTVRTSACAPEQPARCYRVVAGRARVEQSDDGGRHWSTAWELSAGREKYLRRTGDFGAPVRGESLAFASTSLVVLPAPGGHVVLVADQNDGIVERDVHGHWARKGLAGFDPGTAVARPVTGLGDGIAMEYLFALSAGWVVVLVGLATVRVRRQPIRAVRAGQGLRVALGLAWLAVVGLLGRADSEPSATRVVVLAAIGAVVLFALSIRKRRLVVGGRLRRTLAGAALGTTLLTLLPYWGWTVARPDSYGVASALACLFALCGFAGVAIRVWHASTPA